MDFIDIWIIALIIKKNGKVIKLKKSFRKVF